MGSRKRLNFSLKADTCILGALALLLLPLKWILAAVLAAAFHECCHMLALRLCGVRIHSFSVGASGAVMETEPMRDIQELFCALAGPMGSFLLVVLIRIFPELAICAAVQGMYNLIPVCPLDGGRVIRSVLSILIPDRQEQIMKCIRNLTCLIIICLGLIGFWYLKLGFGMLVPVLLWIYKGLGRKIPCKEAHKGVQ